MEGITETVVPSRFIEANTEPVSLSEIREKHLIPVFVKDNQPTISQVDFIRNAPPFSPPGEGPQHFHFFIGYKVKVCTNLCVWTDGYSGDLKVRNLQDLTSGIFEVAQSYRSAPSPELISGTILHELKATLKALAPSSCARLVCLNR